jgi:hypothetical protein
MTCREFKHNAASLSLLELAQTQDGQLLAHVQSCAACDGWMERQRSLNGSLHTLRVSIAGHEAGPDVERALLRVFRQGIPAGSAQAAVPGVKEPMETLRPQFKAVPSSTPFALRLSRFFEMGAYAAVAAAVVIAILLSVHLLWHGANPPRSTGVAERTTVQQPKTVAAEASAAPVVSEREVVPRHPLLPSAERGTVSAAPNQAGAGRSTSAAADDSQGDNDAGYMALMLCDPLSCSSDTQVVRMELPQPSGAQPQVADVVVGDDGVVRAVRFEN